MRGRNARLVAGKGQAMAGRAKIGRMSLCAALLGLAATGGAQTLQWKEYSYAADGFAVSFENVPDIQKKTVPTDAGPIELRTYSEQIGSVQLMVTVSDYGSALKVKDADAELEGAKNAAVKNAGARLVSEKKFMFDVYPGLEFEAESGTARFTARIYLVGSTLYQTLVAAPVGKPFAGTTEFLDSFKLIAKPGS